ncbi:hypothetical protein E2C01_076330 [Portunus trituberculatus]|uniref:Uncharacterized protein n=1 Tax=Portunus trituberculatus TaxID=210409 RepID=A0A5B7IIM7_PORTR|nr:hypothetical protein [Portunus trituberculatus]
MDAKGTAPTQHENHHSKIYRIAKCHILTLTSVRLYISASSSSRHSAVMPERCTSRGARGVRRK